MNVLLPSGSNASLAVFQAHPEAFRGPGHGQVLHDQGGQCPRMAYQRSQITRESVPDTSTERHGVQVVIGEKWSIMDFGRA